MRLVVDTSSGSLEFEGRRSSAAFPWIVSVGALRVAARAGDAGGFGEQESSSLEVVLDNAAKQAATELGDALRLHATVYDDDGAEYFAGTIESVEVGRLLTLTIAAGGAPRLLSEPVPLRSSRDLGDFSEDAPLAHRYGDLREARFPCVRLSETRYHVADHPFEVDRVFVDEERTEGFEARLESDDAGRTWTVLVFASPIAANQEVTATGTGKRDPRTGALIENPADLLSDVAAIAGIELSFPVLRAQAAAEGLRLAGSVDSGRSVRAWLDEIAASCGAIWTPWGGCLYPAPAAGPVLDLDRYAAGELDDPRATIDDSADVLRVAYDRSDATGRAQHALELAASPALFGGVVVERVFPWLRHPANAETVGRRILGRMAARRYAVSFNVNRHDLRPGDFVRLVDSPEWHLPGGDPVVMVLGVEIEADAGATRVTGETVLSEPSLRVAGYSVALADTTEGGVDVTFRNGVATFTVRDEDGRPIAGARVTLDGSAPRTSDDRGIVSFVTVQGPHELLVEVPGFATNRIEFEL